MKTTLLTSAAVFLTVAAAEHPPKYITEVVVPVLAPTAGNLMGVEAGEAALPSPLPEPELVDKRGIPAALHSFENFPYGVPRPHVPKLTLTTPAPTPAPKPTPGLRTFAHRGEEEDEGHGHGDDDDDTENYTEKVISVIINSETILIPQEGITTVQHHHKQTLARPTNVYDHGPHHYGHPDHSGEEEKNGSGGVGELLATVIQDGASTTLAIGVQPTIAPVLAKRYEAHHSTKPAATTVTESPADPEAYLKHDELLVYYGNDLIYVPQEGPVSVSYGPRVICTPAPSSAIESAIVVQNGQSLTMDVSDLSSALPMIPERFLTFAITTTIDDTTSSTTSTTSTKDAGPPYVTGYPPEWNSLHPRLVSLTSADMPTPAATARSLPSTLMTAVRSTA